MCVALKLSFLENKCKIKHSSGKKNAMHVDTHNTCITIQGFQCFSIYSLQLILNSIRVNSTQRHNCSQQSRYVTPFGQTSKQHNFLSHLFSLAKNPASMVATKLLFLELLYPTVKSRKFSKLIGYSLKSIKAYNNNNNNSH